MKLLMMMAASMLMCTQCVEYSATQLKGEITDLPGLPAPVGFKMFSGYVPVDNAGKRQIFYWFVEAEKDSANAPVVLWTNGGPGCSGLGGFMTEQGPFRPRVDGNLDTNPYAWNQVANMLFIEQPAGVGFSTAPSDTVYGDAQAATDNYFFIKGFFKQFPQFNKNAFYASSESYGGHYMPQLAREIVTRGDIPNFKGFAVGNPLTYMPYRDFGQYGTYAYHQLIPQPLFQQYLTAGCDKDDSSDACDDYMTQMDDLVDGMDPYALDFPYCDGLDGGRHQRFTMIKTIRRAHAQMGKKLRGYFPDQYDACAENHGADYLNRADVQAAIHVRGNVSWSMCSDTVGNGYNDTDTVLPMMDNYKFLIQNAKLNILVYSGDDDSICATLGSQQWIWNLGQAVTSKWAPWKAADASGDPQTAGFIVQFDGFSFATVHGAGHMVPQTRPAQALDLFKKFLAGTW